MRLLLPCLLTTFIVASPAFAKDDHHECEEALGKLKAATEADFTSSGHHEHQQAKAARESGDYKKCADQANKALNHIKQK
ncbi:Uncharacterized protein ALO41_00776 [Pseudomonas amygdali pv. ulmi]|uniref:Uncharacterized protein n=1 Tax=Pseudomonas amygdali pv. ulmi TaxID=251720 RepID=A0A0Q0CZV7_PSEA0|nr:hypothetical protein [Pseudomonas amygdali]KPZ10735.1 Uncharacterized protein ALO41_00776 [Pseudomonas amygdali pv. ulmi]KWS13559.1 hypothetical protein AL065_29390 [Pseudomonas amygdali pv. ulmi]